MTGEADAGGALRASRAPAFAFVALALAVRLLPWRTVFLDGAGGGVHFTDSDAYYHARRILYDLAAFPGTLDFDRYLNFPAGAKAIWPQTFDWLIAACLWPFGLADDPTSVERVIVFVPPLLGAATVYLLHRIARAHFGAGVAHLAAFVLALLPAHYWYSQLGFVDHHAAVAFTSTLALALALRVYSSAAEGKGDLRIASGLGIVLALNLLIWPGAVLHVSLALAALLLGGVTSGDAAMRNALLRHVALACAVAFVVVAPASLGNTWPQWGPYSAVVLTNFQPWFFGVVGLSAWVAATVDHRRGDASTMSRVALALAIGVAFVVASFVVIPELAASVRDSSQWLGRTDAFQAMVGESVPLFTLHGRFTTAVATSRLSLFVYLFPLAAAWLAWRAREDERRGVVWIALGWAAVLFAFTLLQKRFFNSFSVWMALTMALAVSAVVERWWRGESHGRRIGALICIVFLLPSLAFYRGPLRLLASDPGSETAATNPRLETSRARRVLVNWLREHTPETSGYLDAAVAPEYGVLARWGEGHFITYGARRPAVIGNFGDDLGRDHFVRARSFFDASPEAAAPILDELAVRYVVIASARESRAMAKRLFRFGGSRTGRFRFVHETAPLEGTTQPAYKIFEYVPGAMLEGRAEPRSLVRAELECTTRDGRAFVYEEVAEADAEGNFRIRVAHPNRAHPGGVVPADRYRVSTDEGEIWVEVLPAAVVQGSSVRVGEISSEANQSS